MISATRAATESERAILARMLAEQPTTGRRWREAVGNALVLWAASLLMLVIVWSTVAWVMRKTSGVDIGWRSLWALPTLGVAAMACAAYSAWSSLRWIRSRKDLRSALQADIGGGVVLEEHYSFVEARRFREPEHGGLMYFLHDRQDQVLVLFDHESQCLGLQGRDPLDSDFAPRTELVMVRAPASGVVVDKRFSGDVLSAGEPRELAVRPAEWPQPERCCAIPWNELDTRLGVSR